LGYNAQAAVDAKSQVIVATYVAQEPNYKREIVPLVEAMTTNLKGDKPRRASADNGYYSLLKLHRYGGREAI
jgi:hypothetical protein